MMAIAAASSILSGCGGAHSDLPAPIVLTVTVNQSPITISPGATVYVPVTIVAPTETVTFTMQGLPAGIASSYKESESNPSGQLTLVAAKSVTLGSYPCTITVETLSQTASTTVPVKVVATHSS